MQEIGRKIVHTETVFHCYQGIILLVCSILYDFHHKMWYSFEEQMFVAWIRILVLIVVTVTVWGKINY